MVAIRTTFLRLGWLLACVLGASGPAPPGDSARAVAVANSDQPTSHCRDGRVGQGRGVLVKITRGTRIEPEALERVKNQPHVTGVQVTTTWAELEPQKGMYRWDEIEHALDQYGSIGKQVALMFVTAAGKVPTGGQLNKGKGRAGPDEEFENSATPSWLFDDPQVRRVGGVKTVAGEVPLYPVFWDPAYQRHLGELLAAFARRFDGDPRLEFIRMGGWQVGTNEPSFYGGATAYLQEQLAAEGEIVGGRRRPELTADGKYAQAVRELVDLWHRHFKKTRLAATIHFDRRGGGFEAAMNEHCAQQGCTLLNTGLNERDHADARSFFRRMHDERHLKVGWGGITHLGSEGRQDSHRANRKAASNTLLEAFRQGIGADGDDALRPASRVSYVVIGLDSLSNPDAVEWVAGQLVE